MTVRERAGAATGGLPDEGRPPRPVSPGSFPRTKDPVVSANSSPANGALPEAALERMKRAVEEAARLLQAPLRPAEFHAEFLQRVLDALGGVAAALWSRSPEG